MATDPVADLREAAALMRERALAARDLTDDGHGKWFPWGVVQQTEWREWPEPRPVPVPFAFDGSTEMATGAHEPTGEAFVAHPRFAHDQEEAWHEAEFIAGPMPEPVAAFIASCHPGVALAVADWLDATANDAAEFLAIDTPEGPCCSVLPACPGHGQAWGCERCGEFMGGGCKCWDGALKTARAYLGTTGKDGTDD